MNLTKEDIQNLLILINKAPLTGAEAATVAALQSKLRGMEFTIDNPVTYAPDRGTKKGN